MFTAIGTLMLALGAACSTPGQAEQLLLTSLEQAELFEFEELTRGLGALPPDEVPALFAVLELGAVPVEGGAPVELDEFRLEAVLNAFALLSPTAVRTHLRGLRGPSVTERTRETAAFVLGRMGTREDTLTLVSVAAPADPAQPVGRALQQAVTDAMTRILVRDPRALWELPEAYDRCHEALLASIPRAIRAARPPEGLQILVDLLGRAPAADALILAEIGAFGETVNGVVDPFVLEKIRAYLGRADARLVQGAALAVRKLDDTYAVAELVQLLRHPDANVRKSVDLALQRVADRNFRGDPDRWDQWYAEQLLWWESDSRRLVADLGVGDKALVARALNELSTRRIYRQEFGPALIGVLSSPDPGLAVLACSVTAKVGLRHAVPELTELVEHQDLAVAVAAREALRRIQTPGGSLGPLAAQSQSTPRPTRKLP